MANVTSPKSTGGRPKNYTSAQVADVIETLISNGVRIDQIDGKAVKPLLCEKHGVSSGIRLEGLYDVVEGILATRAEEEAHALLKALPAEVEPTVNEILAGVKNDLLSLVANINAKCMAAAEQECILLRTDKRTAHWRIVELEARVKEQAAQITALAKENEAAQAEVTAAREELGLARQDLDRTAREARTIDRLLAELRNPALRDDIRAFLAELAPVPTQ